MNGCRTETILAIRDVCSSPPQERARSSATVCGGTGALVERNLEDGLCSGSSYIVTPCLYSLWSLFHHARVELFADALNEIGCLVHFCSLDLNDKVFGSLGTWEELEMQNSTMSAAGNPPFTTELLTKMTDAFEDGIKRIARYCRVAIVPSSHGVQDRVCSLSTEAEVLLHIPAGNIGFKPQSELFLGKHARYVPNPHWEMELLLFVWVNRPFLELHAQPRDIHHAYASWVSQACLKPSTVRVDADAFQRAFPEDLRSSVEVAHLLDY